MVIPKWQKTEPRGGGISAGIYKRSAWHFVNYRGHLIGVSSFSEKTQEFQMNPEILK
jgi:hypothetical protein